MNAWMANRYPRTAWNKLPLALRQRWWQETRYGRDPPSEALRKEIDVIVFGTDSPDVAAVRRRGKRAKGVRPFA